MAENVVDNKDITNSNNKRVIIYAIITSILSFIAICGIVYFYSGYTTRVSMERGNYLSDLSEKVAENTNIIISDKWNYTRAISNVVIRSNSKTKEQLIKSINEAEARSDITDIQYMVVDDDGNYYTSDGVEGKWDEKSSFFKEGKEERKVFITKLGRLRIKEPQIVFLYKLPKDVELEDGINIRYVAYIQSFEKFANGMDLSEHKNTQLLQIINKEGEILYSHNFIKNIPNKENIDDVLTKSTFLDKGSLKEYRRQIKNREVNSKKFKYKGEVYYLSYAPINIDDWGILHVLRQEELYKETGQFFTYSFYSIIGVAICICILIIMVLYMIVMLRNNNNMLNIKEDSNIKLKKAVDEANYANKAKSDFLAHMSHDIRTPINGIMGMTNIAKQNIDDKEMVKNCLEKISISSTHLVSLINDVLDMSRIETGKVSIKHSKMNLENIYNQCMSILRTQAEEHSIELIGQLEDIEHFNVIGDELHLKQVLINILGNAVKFTKENGKIWFNIKEIQSDDKKVRFLFIIKDNGIGMSEEYQKHVFESFTQEDDGSRTSYQGTGLGMAIAKSFIDLMGGTIEVFSKINEGTTFTVELEFDIDYENTKEEKKVIKGQLEGMKVLVAEDNELNKEIIQYILEQENIIVELVSDGREAIEKFIASNEENYDMILMDIMMPVMDGLTATKEIRKLERKDAKSIPIVAMTANAYDEDVKKSLEAGMNEHLTKPIENVKLFEILAKYKKK